MKQYLKNIIDAPTPQSEPLPGTNQVQNSAGGYSWQVTPWEQLRRFLILGSEGGSYYAAERQLTVENASNVLDCIQEDGPRVVAEIVAISHGGRAPKNDPALFALALAASIGDDATRKAALEALPQVARIGTHLFTFAEFVKGMRGWGRGLRSALSNWYLEMDTERLAYQVVKYRQRNGWTHADVLRVAHPKTEEPTRNAILHWVTHREESAFAHGDAIPEDDALALIYAYEAVQAKQHAREVIKLIQDYNLPREAIPTQWLNEVAVWEALLRDMPMTAMLRNLGNMSKIGLLTAGSNAAKMVAARLRDQDRLQKARVHPLAVLAALNVYEGGRALKGGYRGRGGEQDWRPVPTVVDALDDAFHLAFHNIEPTNKRTMLALDVSGSMSMGYIAGVGGITPRVGAAAMAMVTARTEPQYDVVAFQDKMVSLKIRRKHDLKTVIERTSGLPFGGTDCAQPMLYALENKQQVDTFVVYTDSETWAGSIHPVDALHRYRDEMGIPARLIVVGMVSNGFSIADPNDKGMLDVVGFDAAAPQIMADFARGDL